MTVGPTGNRPHGLGITSHVATELESEQAGSAASDNHSYRPSTDSASLTEVTATPDGASTRSSTTLVLETGSKAHSRNHRQLSISPSPHRSEHHAASLDAVQAAAVGGAPQGGRETAKQRSEESEQVTWSSLPRKGQLAILTLARLSEPLTQTSLQSYLYYQLQSFDERQTPAQITAQAGIVTAAFAAAQALTSVLWGRVADARWGGRKMVILVGLLGTALGTLGFGFSTNWVVAVTWRVFAGVLNGNVGVMRTMISEIVKDRKYLSRAFLLMPMCFNIGVILGPIMGGLLADPVGSWPSIFGPGSLLGGANGVGWMTTFPYALPNILSAVYLVAGAALVFLGLEETQDGLRGRPDIGIRIGKTLKRAAQRIWRCRWGFRHDYSALPADSNGGMAPVPGDLESHTPIAPATPLTPFAASHAMGQKDSLRVKKKLPFRRMWTRNVVATLASYSLMAMSVGTFNALWFLFLSAPRVDHSKPDAQEPSLPFRFTGGLGLPPVRIGMAMAILGVIGITMQLFLYPRVSGRWGTLRSFQMSVLLFPIVYLLVPYLAIVPSTTAEPAPTSGPLIWIALASVLAIQVLARTFAIPAGGILVNNAAPHPSVLGTMHGVAQSLSAGARTIGPMGAGWLFGVGLDAGVVGLAFWTMAAVSTLGVIAGLFVREGDGHEILLEGEQDDASDSEEN